MSWPKKYAGAPPGSCAKPPVTSVPGLVRAQLHGDGAAFLQVRDRPAGALEHDLAAPGRPGAGLRAHEVHGLGLVVGERREGQLDRLAVGLDHACRGAPAALGLGDVGHAAHDVHEPLVERDGREQAGRRRLRRGVAVGEVALEQCVRARDRPDRHHADGDRQDHEQRPDPVLAEVAHDLRHRTPPRAGRCTMPPVSGGDRWPTVTPRLSVAVAQGRASQSVGPAPHRSPCPGRSGPSSQEAGPPLARVASRRQALGSSPRAGSGSQRLRGLSGPA